MVQKKTLFFHGNDRDLKRAEIARFAGGIFHGTLAHNYTSIGEIQISTGCFIGLEHTIFFQYHWLLVVR
jgi:hypothetical protein